MARRVTLDAMIPREDFGRDDNEDFISDLIRDFPISNLEAASPILALLRKPDFQRETNHWTPDQIATFVASFLDSEVIPSLILWKSPSYIFVIDGGHRLSALRAWMNDDYGDGAISTLFYKGEISDDQKAMAKRARAAVEQKVGRYSKLKAMVGQKPVDAISRRSNLLFTRSLNLQWVQGNASVAETSFFKINSQGTPLDETESLLIRNRSKPIAIGARAILRSGTGHRYWSAFSEANQQELEKQAELIFKLLFKPEADLPLKTLDVPLGGSTSPVDALALLIEFLRIAGVRGNNPTKEEVANDDATGDTTIKIIANSLDVLKRITGTNSSSLGLHSGVYFYNERGKYSRFLFLGIASLITKKLANNDGGFFKKFTKARAKLEAFLIDNKSAIGIVLQNLNKNHRIPRMSDLFDNLVDRFSRDEEVSLEDAVANLGLRGRFFDISATQSSAKFSDESKSAIYMRSAIKSALRCPICHGLLDPRKSVSYDHIVRVRDGGTGDVDNGQLVHPYCNTGYKN